MVQMNNREIRTRRVKGSSLVELIVAVGISGLLIACLSQSLAELYRLSYVSQNQILAPLLAEQVLERVRSTSFNALQSGVFPIQVKLPDNNLENNSSQPLYLRPLQYDANQYVYGSESAIKSIESKFNGKITLSIQPNVDGIAELKRVSISVVWSEGIHSETKKYDLVAYVCRDALQWDAMR